jgi:protein-tyrosine phosphatase
VRLLLAHLENATGGYRRLKKIHWKSVERVVFVCHGNICRSPYAERRAAMYGLSAASFGLSAEPGMPADPSACRVAARRSVELTEHHACDITDFEFRSGDLLVVMEPRQARAMLRRLPSTPCQLTLLGLWSRPRCPHVHDPHRLGDAYWENCLDNIDSAVRTIAAQLHGHTSDGA